MRRASACMSAHTHALSEHWYDTAMLLANSDAVCLLLRPMLPAHDIQGAMYLLSARLWLIDLACDICFPPSITQKLCTSVQWTRLCVSRCVHIYTYIHAYKCVTVFCIEKETNRCRYVWIQVQDAEFCSTAHCGWYNMPRRTSCYTKLCELVYVAGYIFERVYDSSLCLAHSAATRTRCI